MWKKVRMGLLTVFLKKIWIGGGSPHAEVSDPKVGTGRRRRFEGAKPPVPDAAGWTGPMGCRIR